MKARLKIHVIMQLHVAFFSLFMRQFSLPVWVIIRQASYEVPVNLIRFSNVRCHWTLYCIPLIVPKFRHSLEGFSVPVPSRMGGKGVVVAGRLFWATLVSILSFWHRIQSNYTGTSTHTLENTRRETKSKNRNGRSKFKYPWAVCPSNKPN